MKSYKSRLSVINRGTLYDVTGKMRWAQRKFDREQDVSDVVLVARKRNGSIETYHWGTGERAMAHYMLSTAKNRLEPV